MVVTMIEFTSNAEFLATLQKLIERWCDRRAFVPLAHVLPPYVSFNGLGDGWGELRSGLIAAKALGRDALPEGEIEAVADLLGAIERQLPAVRG